jgi:hypothetical protein
MSGLSVSQRLLGCGLVNFQDQGVVRYEILRNWEVSLLRLNFFLILAALQVDV